MGEKSPDTLPEIDAYMEGRLDSGKPEKMEHHEPFPEACALYHVKGVFQPVLHNFGQFIGGNTSIWPE